ncbi:MAG: hypothetical protein AAGA48_22285 [Myxococcota bacterium]
MKGLVLQSHRLPLPAPWLRACLDSVEAWAQAQGLAYRFIDDGLFDLVPNDLMQKCVERRVVATDLARLAWLQRSLDEGVEVVMWCDADLLVVDPERLKVPDAAYSVGREIWVENQNGRPRVRRHVHNAWLSFRNGNPMLTFYRHAAERMVRAHRGPMVPQFIGPKLLTALHNLIGFPVAETVNMLSPVVLHDVVAGGGRFLSAYLDACHEIPAAVNLCGSLIASEAGSDDLVRHAIDRMLKTPTW